jgi:hypothetical protein
MRITSSPTVITVNSSSLPAWVPAPGQYATVSTGMPSAADPCPNGGCVYTGTQGFPAIWRVWNGGAYAPLLGQMGSLLMFGGGHYAYNGNCVIAYDVAARRFVRLNDPAPYSDGSVGSDGSYPNGTPYPNHTNMGCEYLPPDAGGGPLGSYVFISHSQTGVNISNPTIWRFDLQARTWSKGPSGFQGGRQGLCYDPRRKGLWVICAEGNGRRVYFANMMTNQKFEVGAGSVGGTLTLYWYGNGVYLPTHDLLIIGAQNRVLTALNLSSFNPGSNPPSFVPRFDITQSGTRLPTLQIDSDGYCAERLEFCPLDGGLYGLDRSSRSSARLYKLQPPATNPSSSTWTWTSETLTAMNGESLAFENRPGEGDVNFWGRLRWVPPVKSFVYSDAGTLPAQAARPRIAV